MINYSLNWMATNSSVMTTTYDYWATGATNGPYRSIAATAPAPLRFRQPAPLEFNPYINAAEMVVEFMEGARGLLPDLTRERFLRLPVADFFAFLLRRAAAADGVAAPDLPAPLVEGGARRPRCAQCGRFLPGRFELLRIYHCGPICLDRALGPG